MLLFFDVSGGELLVIMAAVFLVFGPKRVPEIARQMGKGMNELKKVTSDLTKEFQEGADLVKKEMNQVKDTVQTERIKFNRDIIMGPSEFPDDYIKKDEKFNLPEEKPVETPQAETENTSETTKTT
jgi:sec-independent protein translocase protein TatA